MLLQCTSALFATIVFHAHLRRQTDVVALSLLVTVFSLWFHCTRDPTILRFDMFFAHLYFVYTAVKLCARKSKILVLSVSLACTYVLLCRATERKLLMHFIMHCQVLAGSHLLIANAQ